MRGLKRDSTARVIVAGHAFTQNLRRGHYDLGTDVQSTFRIADAFAELASVIGYVHGGLVRDALASVNATVPLCSHTP